MLKKYFYLYQRAMWYFGLFVDEGRKPLRLYNEAGLFVLLIGYFGVKLQVIHILFGYVGIAILGVIGGVVLVKTGVVKFNQGLANSQNPELLEIKHMVEELKQNK